MKEEIYHLIEKGSFGKKVNLWFDYFITALIFLNVAAIAVESISNLDSRVALYLHVFDIFSVLVFTIEYLLRLYVSDLIYPSKTRLKSMLKFIFSPLGLIDLFAILPFYLPFIFKADLRFLRVLRLFRFVRVFKITRYNKTLKMFGDVFREKKTELGMTIFSVFIILIVSSFLMYFIEGKAQPDKFQNVFAAMWWSVITLTTIGYGDVYPLTVAGKILGGLVSVLGIGVIALPTGILSSGFIDILHRSRTGKENIVCPHCHTEFEHNVKK